MLQLSKESDNFCNFHKKDIIDRNAPSEFLYPKAQQTVENTKFSYKIDKESIRKHHSRKIQKVINSASKLTWGVNPIYIPRGRIRRETFNWYIKEVKHLMMEAYEDFKNWHKTELNKQDI